MDATLLAMVADIAEALGTWLVAGLALLMLHKVHEGVGLLREMLDTMRGEEGDGGSG